MEEFKRMSNIIIANHLNLELDDVKEKIYTWDPLERD
jgi:hypothetical protein